MDSSPQYPNAPTVKMVVAGLAAGVLGHILQGAASYFIFDRFYLANPELVRDSSRLVGFLYLFLDLVVGLVISFLAQNLKAAPDEPDWRRGVRAALLVWAASSPVFIIKRQMILNLPDWLLLEAASDLLIYAVIGAAAGYLAGRGITDFKEVT